MTDEALVAVAHSMLDRAYAPYSHFSVGAALLCRDGSVFTGCNIENAAYGLCLCAERTALVKAVSEGHAHDWDTLAVISRGDDFCWPCGACRQMLYEFHPTLRILVARGDQSYQAVTLDQLMPHGFGPEQLDDFQ